jgi:hypothetical protein
MIPALLTYLLECECTTYRRDEKNDVDTEGGAGSYMTRGIFRPQTPHKAESANYVAAVGTTFPFHLHSCTSYFHDGGGRCGSRRHSAHILRP